MVTNPKGVPNPNTGNIFATSVGLLGAPEIPDTIGALDFVPVATGAPGALDDGNGDGFVAGSTVDTPVLYKYSLNALINCCFLSVSIN